MNNEKGQKREKEDTKIVCCNVCNVKCRNNYDLNRHFLTSKHTKNQLENENEQKSAEPENILFECIKCKFQCSKKYDWERHIQTQKHKKAEIVEKNKDKIQCECGKYYSSKSGMWMHKKKCNFNKANEISKFDKELILFLLKQNNELLDIIKAKLIEQPIISTNLNNNTTTEHMMSE
jgi:hypothetical protein